MSLLPTSPLPSTPAQTVQSETPTAQNTVIPKKRKIKDNSRPLSDDDELLREDVDNALSDFYRDRGLVYDVAEKKTVYPPFRFLQEVEVEVVSQTANGDGLGMSELGGGWAVIVPFVLPGERAKARVFKNYHGYSKADYISVLRAAPNRIAPECPHFTVCSGCRLQHISYKDQLTFKHGIINRALKASLPDLGGNAEAEFPIGSPLEYAYRTKATPHFDLPKKLEEGETVKIGFLMEGRRKVLDVEDCPIVTKSVNEGIKKVREQVHTNIAKYKRGATLLVRETTNEETGEKSFETDSKKMITEVFGNLKFKFPAGAFFQNNNSILPLLTSYVSQQLATPSPISDKPTRYLVDAYCGSGLFAVSCHNPFEKVVGIEISKDSVSHALANAKLNGAEEKCSFITGSAENIFETVRKSAEEGGLGWNGDDTAMVIDPPRKGCNDSFLNQLLDFKPRVCVYVSCNVFSQARDLIHLREKYEKGKDSGVPKYRMVAARPFDLFPSTRHIESVVTLVRDN